MKIRMTEQDLDNLAAFLNRKYEERRTKARQDGRKYSMTRFAKDVGINQPTMSRLMKLGPDKTPVEGIDTPILIALWDEFGAEIMEALRGDSIEVKKNREG